MNTDSATSDKNSPGDFAVDIVGMYRRHFPVIAFCTVLFLLLGIAYCFMTEEVFESKAEILIRAKQSPAFNDQTIKDRNPVDFTNQLETHKLVLSSPSIIDRATSEYELDKLATFKDAAEPSEIWNENLEVEVPEREASILELRFRTTDPEECHKIVDAMLNTYKAHLTETSTELGDEISNLILKGKDELRDQLKSLEKEYAEFQRKAPLLWREGEGVNIFQERQSEIEEKRSALLLEKTLLAARIRAVSDAVSRGGESIEAIYHEALLELRGTNDENTIERESTRGFGFELSKEYVELVAQERAMSLEFGDGHPDLVSLRARVDQLRTAVESSMGRKLADGINVDLNSDEMAHPEYVQVYLRMLIERNRSYDVQISSLDQEFDQANAAAEEIQLFITQDQSLRADQKRTEKLFDAVVARLEEINIIQDYGGETMKVIAPASMGKKVWPRIPIVLALSMLLGGLFGSAWALLRELTLRVFNDPQQVRDVLQAPVLGQIPMHRPSHEGTQYPQVDPAVGVVHDGQGRFSEAFRGIRTALHYSTCSEQSQVFQVTSPTPGDGKSTTAANLAATIAKSQKRVVLVDADMRKPTVHTLFGLQRNGGLSEVLSGESRHSEVIRSTEIPDLDILTAGAFCENPAELLTFKEFDELLVELRSLYDVVLVDTPPVLAVSDPCIIAPRVDGVVMVVRIREKVRAATEKARDALREVGATVIGAAVNGIVLGRRGFGYGKGYMYSAGYSYGSGYADADSYYGQREVPREPHTRKKARRQKKQMEVSEFT